MSFVRFITWVFITLAFGIGVYVFTPYAGLPIALAMGGASLDVDPIAVTQLPMPDPVLDAALVWAAILAPFFPFIGVVIYGVWRVTQRIIAALRGTGH